MVSAIEALRIGTKDDSQEFFQEAVNTIPVHVEYAKIQFTYAGIPRLRYKEEDEEYISKCIEQGVMPFSQLKLKYRNNLKCFIPETSLHEGLLDIYADSSEKRKNVAFDNVLNGGKIHSIETIIGDGSIRFEDFREEILKKILGAGYHLSNGDLWLSSYHGSGYNWGDSRASGMIFRPNIGVELQLANHPNADEKQKLIDWFTKLTEKRGGFYQIP